MQARNENIQPVEHLHGVDAAIVAATTYQKCKMTSRNSCETLDPRCLSVAREFHAVDYSIFLISGFCELSAFADHRHGDGSRVGGVYYGVR